MTNELQFSGQTYTKSITQLSGNPEKFKMRTWNE